MTLDDAETAAERTLASAVGTGILKRDRVAPSLSEVRKNLEAVAGVAVELSIVKRGGKFDRGPLLPDP